MVGLHFVGLSVLIIASGCCCVSDTGNDDDDAEQHLACPDFSKYLYFLFAPTLVYRDTYPR